MKYGISAGAITKALQEFEAENLRKPTYEDTLVVLAILQHQELESINSKQATIIELLQSLNNATR